MSRQLSAARKPVPGLVASARLSPARDKEKSKVSNLEVAKEPRFQHLLRTNTEDSGDKSASSNKRGAFDQSDWDKKLSPRPKYDSRILLEDSDEENTSLPGAKINQVNHKAKPPIDYIDTYTKGSTVCTGNCETCECTGIKQYGSADSIDSNDSEKTVEISDNKYLKRRHIDIHINDDCIYTGSRARTDYQGIGHWIVQNDFVTPIQSEPSHWNHLVAPQHRQPHDKPPICLKTGSNICILCMHHRQCPLIVSCHFCGIKVHKDCKEWWFTNHHEDTPSNIPRECCPFCREFIPTAQHRQEERKNKGYIARKIKEAEAWWARSDNYIHKQLILFSNYFYNNHQDKILIPLNYREDYYNVRTYNRSFKRLRSNVDC